MVDKLPYKSSDDTLHTATKAIISAWPVVGGPAAELFNYLIQPPLEKRRDEWLQGLADEINRLSERVDGFDINELAKNEQFITILMHASQVALRNHQKAKLAALKAAVINTAQNSDGDENLRLIFINMVDDLTPMHLEVLAIVQNPRKWADDHEIATQDYYMGSREQVVSDILGSRRPSYLDQIYSDLHSRGLVKTDSLKGMVTASSMWDSLTE